MSMTPQDWRKLRNPIIGLGAAFIIVGIVISFADQYRKKTESALLTQQNLLNQARQKFQSSGLEKDTITQYLPAYNELIKNGFIGEEQRIEWIETLRQIHHEHKLFSIDYSIGLQENYSAPFLTNTGGFIVHRSVMKLNLSMLHEGDLLTLLDGLKAQSTPFIVRECEISRPIGLVINTKTISENLKAACEIDWITLRDPQLTGAI